MIAILFPLCLSAWFSFQCLRHVLAGNKELRWKYQLTPVAAVHYASSLYAGLHALWWILLAVVFTIAAKGL